MLVISAILMIEASDFLELVLGHITYNKVHFCALLAAY